MRFATAVKGLSFCVFSVLMCSAKADQSVVQTPKMVECDGNSVIKVDNIIGAQTPFHALFSIDGDTVTMVEGDSMRFSKTYQAKHDITQPDRPGYGSSNGNLFFYKTSGRFEIFKMGIVNGAVKTEQTSGQCKSFTPSNVFN